MNQHKINVSFSLNQSVFLYKNLFYNRKIKREVFYFHFLKNQDHSIDLMVEYLKEFFANRVNTHSKDIISIGHHNYISISIDKYRLNDYIISNGSCLFCKRILNNFDAMVLHIKLCHDNYDTYFTKSTRLTTRVKQLHIFCFFKKEGRCNSENDEIPKTFYFSFNKLAKLSQQKMILFKSEINLLLSKKKEIEKYNQKKKRIHEICLQGKIIFEKNRKICDKSIIQKKEENNIKESIKKSNHLVKPTIKKNIILHKKTKLLKNRYFNSITGQLLEQNDLELLSNEFLTYEVEKNHLNDTDHKLIDEYYDLSEKDKTFFKLWNDFIENSDSKTISLLEKLLNKFINKHFDQIIERDLNDVFVLHMINLYDYGLINRCTYKSVIKNFDEIITNINFINEHQND